MPRKLKASSIAWATLVALAGCSSGDFPTPVTPPNPNGFELKYVAPSSGTAMGGTGVTLFGKGFAPGATVWFGSLQASLVVVQDSSTIQAVTPPSPAGTVDVTVRDGMGSQAVLPGGYYFEALQ